MSAGHARILATMGILLMSGLWFPLMSPLLPWLGRLSCRQHDGRYHRAIGKDVDRLNRRVTDALATDCSTSRVKGVEAPESLAGLGRS